MRRSRLLWDEARRTDGTALERSQRWLHVILYEIQPFRLSKVDAQRFHGMLRSMFETTKSLTKNSPSYAANFAAFLRGRTKHEWLAFAVVLAYCKFVKIAHEYLDAGPIVLIISGLVAIFTFGLGDNENTDGLSAYSVFNRGFQKLLGEVDANALLAQHVGLGMGMAMQPAGMMDHDDNRDGNINNDRQRHRRRRAPRQEANVRNEGNDNDDGGDNDAEQEEVPDPPVRARMSGKKLRRRNMQERNEQRDEIQRQRDAARQLGFDGEGDERMAMQHILEEQIRENELNNVEET